MYIGYLADIVFYTALDNVLTVSDVTRSGSARWEKHNLMLEKRLNNSVGLTWNKLHVRFLFPPRLDNLRIVLLRSYENIAIQGLYCRLLLAVNLLVKTTLSSCL